MLITGLWFRTGGSAFHWNLPSVRRLKGKLLSASRPPGVINSSADEWLWVDSITPVACNISQPNRKGKGHLSQDKSEIGMLALNACQLSALLAPQYQDWIDKPLGSERSNCSKAHPRRPVMGKTCIAKYLLEPCHLKTNGRYAFSCNTRVD